LNNPLIVPELAAFNFEINNQPLVLRANALRRMHEELDSLWSLCHHAAARLGSQPFMIGTLPTVGPAELKIVNMSQKSRYYALNQQILRLRGQRPVVLDIAGRQHLQKHHADIMPESAATSFQIHLQVEPAQAPRVFNAGHVLAAPMVAACTNSPFLFGMDLWDETRIPLFEQAVAVADQTAQRVTFGRSYLGDSVQPYFEENLARFPVLLPALSDEPVSRLAHLRLHNGTIWRWNRLLIDFNSDGAPTLRLEHRVVPAGPSIIDTIANAALFYGLIEALVQDPVPFESCLPFAIARENFYSAAREGLGAKIRWLDDREWTVRDLLLERLLEGAKEGLRGLAIDARDIDRYLGIINERVRSGKNGTVWQRQWVKAHGNDMAGLTLACLKCQQSGLPVHEWPVYE
jgi:hypothetical protein